MKPKTLYRWYRDQISDFHKDIEEKKFAAHQVYSLDKETGEVLKSKVVHILKPENVGPSMSIDEKMIGGKYCTLLSNQQTGKIALLLESLKPDHIEQALKLIPENIRSTIESLTLDMSPMFNKICTQLFTHAQLVIDKFHVIKHLMDALNTVRLELKKKLKASKTIKPDNPNGWTDVQLVEKTKYLLYKAEHKLSEEEKIWLEKVLSLNDELKQAYQITNQLRDWYHSKNVGQKPGLQLHALKEWIAGASKIDAFQLVVNLLEKHRDKILAYFTKGQTSARAENLNGRIQRFIIANYGTRDPNFFYYRTQIYFS